MQRAEEKTSAIATGAGDHGEPGQAARRALAEAGERRRLAASSLLAAQKEINGRGGPDPVRFGDWEVKGIASDF